MQNPISQKCASELAKSIPQQQKRYTFKLNRVITVKREQKRF